MGESYPFLVANGGAPVTPPTGWRSLQRTPAVVFDYIMSEFAAREGKSRWCEKSPMHVQHISLLAEAFPAAQFIHVVRDGRDCAVSFHRRWGYRPRSTIYRWKRAVNDGRTQGALLGAGSYLEVTFERLTEKPALQLAEVCKFLNVDFVDEILRAGRAASRVKGLSELEIVENSGRYKTYLAPGELSTVERIAGRTLAQFGYATEQPESDYDPPALLRKYWLTQDRLRFAARLVIGKARSPQPFPWRLLASRIRRSLRHVRSERY
jgi:hypothetical protein